MRKITLLIIIIFAIISVNICLTQNIESVQQMSEKIKKQINHWQEPKLPYPYEESGNQDYKVLLMQELNHRFQQCKIGTEKEYTEIEESISPEVLEIISKWILAKIR